jgi:cell division protein ZapA
MSDKERLVKFELLGQEYKFYTASSEEELRSIYALVRQLVEATGSSQTTGSMLVSRVAVLACLNIASRYVKLQQEFDEYRWDSEQRIIRLSEEIRAKLLSE